MGVLRVDPIQLDAQRTSNKKQHREWHVKTLEGRKNGRRTIAKRTDAIPTTTIRNAKNRLNGHKGHRPPNTKRDGYQEAVEKVPCSSCTARTHA